MMNWFSSRRWIILMALVIAPALLATAYAAQLAFSSSGRERFEGEDTCRKPLTGVDAELDARIDNRGASPSLGVSMLVDLPNDSYQAWELLRRERDDERYKLALQCVLGKPEAWSGHLPSVKKEGDRVVVRVDAQKRVGLTPDMNKESVVGPMVIRVFDPQPWRATIEPPESLSLARWRQVSVTAPADWLGGPQPYLGTAMETERIRWERLVSQTPGLEIERIRWANPLPTIPRDGDLASFTVHPDTRTQIASTVGAPEWNWLRTLLPRLDGIFLVGLVILWAHRARATLVRRMCLPILVVTSAVTALSIGIGYTSDAWLAGVIAAPVIMVAAAIAWGVRWQLAVAVGAEAVLLSLVAFLKPAWIPDGLADLASVVAWTFAGFQFTLLLLTGLINAARVLLANPKSLSPPLWVWISGAVVSAMLVLEQMVSTQSYYLSPWADREAAPLEDMGGLMGAYPTSVIMSIDLVILTLGVAGIWALIRHRVENKFVILLFAMGASCWSVAPFGTWLPMWPLAFLVLWMWLRYSRPLLDKQLPPTETTVGSVIRADNADQIRAAAAMWGRIRNRGRALDRDLAKGTIPLDRYQQETKALLDMQMLPSGDVQTVSALRAASVSPVDVVLAVGPGTTPWENAKHGVKIAALVGVPAAVLKLWLWGRALPERPPSPLYSPLLKWAAMAVWESTLWLTAGAVLGLLWQKLPFRRGIGKALPLITAFSATELARAVPLETPGGNVTALVNIALFAAVVLVTALFMDLGALRSTDTWWSRRRDALAAAYGMENLATQVTFVAAQAAAVLTIVTLVQEGIVEKVTEEPTRPPPVQTK